MKRNGVVAYDGSNKYRIGNILPREDIEVHAVNKNATRIVCSDFALITSTHIIVKFLAGVAVARDAPESGVR